jgi:PncC family amidohydrolase
LTKESSLDILSEKILEELRIHDLSLALAESCTGGFVSSCLTNISGSSDVFSFGLITYSRESKEEFLGVPSRLIAEFGTISAECAKAMAEGLLLYEVDLGMSVTGVLGSPVEGQFKGTVFIAIAFTGKEVFCKELVLDPQIPRKRLKEIVTKELFSYLLELLPRFF